MTDTIADKSDLLPCPFCGQQPEWRPQIEDPGRSSWWPEHVQCKRCRIIFRKGEYGCEDPIKQWNKRTEPRKEAETQTNCFKCNSSENLCEEHTVPSEGSRESIKAANMLLKHKGETEIFSQSVNEPTQEHREFAVWVQGSPLGSDYTDYIARACARRFVPRSEFEKNFKNCQEMRRDILSLTSERNRLKQIFLHENKELTRYRESLEEVSDYLHDGIDEESQKLAKIVREAIQHTEEKEKCSCALSGTENCSIHGKDNIE